MFKSENSSAQNNQNYTYSINLLNNTLSEATIQKNFKKQIEVLLELAKKYLNEKNYSASAKLYNGALAIFQENSKSVINAKDLESKIITALNKVEILFITEVLGMNYQPKSEAPGVNPAHYKKLLEIRAITIKKSDAILKDSTLSNDASSDKIQLLFEWIAAEMNGLVVQILTDCISLMGSKPPCDYALVSTGSLAREEMTPYSDLECFILISEDTPSNKQYFRLLSQLFELKIINLGETDLVKGYSLLPKEIKNPTPKGFSLDVHKNPTNPKLIGTPEELAKFQHPDNYVHEPRNHLSVSLINVKMVDGNPMLFDKYKALTTPTRHKELAAKTMQGDLNKFEPTLGKQLETNRLVDIKDDLYRLPTTILDSISLCYLLQSVENLKRLDELLKNKFISPTTTTKLKYMFSQIMHLRLRIYLHYEMQKEEIFHENIHTAETEKNLKSKQEFWLTEADLQHLFNIYKILIPFHEAVVDFCNNDNGESLFNFADNTNVQDNIYEGIILERLGKFDKAETLFGSLFMSGITSNTLLSHYAAVSFEMRHLEKAAELYQALLANEASTSGRTIRTLKNLARVYAELSKDKFMETWHSVSIQYFDLFKNENNKDNINIFLSTKNKQNLPYYVLEDLLRSFALIYRTLISSAFVTFKDFIIESKDKMNRLLLLLDLPSADAKNHAEKALQYCSKAIIELQDDGLDNTIDHIEIISMMNKLHYELNIIKTLTNIQIYLNQIFLQTIEFLEKMPPELDNEEMQKKMEFRTTQEHMRDTEVAAANFSHNLNVALTFAPIMMPLLLNLYKVQKLVLPMVDKLTILYTRLISYMLVGFSNDLTQNNWRFFDPYLYLKYTEVSKKNIFENEQAQTAYQLLMTFGDSCYNLRIYDSKDCYQQALKLAELKFGPGSPLLIPILIRIGDLHFIVTGNENQENISTALKHYLRAFNIAKTFYTLSSWQAGICYNRAWKTWLAISNHKLIMSFYTIIAEMTENVFGGDDIRMGFIFEEVGNVFMIRDQMSDAATFFNKAYDIALKHCGENSGNTIFPFLQMKIARTESLLKSLFFGKKEQFFMGVFSKISKDNRMSTLNYIKTFFSIATEKDARQEIEKTDREFGKLLFRYFWNKKTIESNKAKIIEVSSRFAKKLAENDFNSANVGYVLSDAFSAKTIFTIFLAQLKKFQAAINNREDVSELNTNDILVEFQTLFGADFAMPNPEEGDLLDTSSIPPSLQTNNGDAVVFSREGQRLRPRNSSKEIEIECLAGQNSDVDQITFDSFKPKGFDSDAEENAPELFIPWWQDSEDESKQFSPPLNI